MASYPSHKFGSWFFGYNKAQVESYLKRLILEYEQKLAGLDSRVSKIVAETKELSDQVDLLLSRLTTHQIRAHILEVVEKETQKIASNLLESGRQQAAEILQSVQEELKIYSLQVEQIESEIALLRKQFSELMGALLEMVSAKAKMPAHQVEVSDKVVMRILPNSQKASAFVEDLSEGLARLDLDVAGRKIVSQSNIPIGEVGRLILNKNGGAVVGYEVTASCQPAFPNGSVIPASSIAAIRKDALVVSNEYLTKGGFQPLVRPQTDGQLARDLSRSVDESPNHHISIALPPSEEQVNLALKSLQTIPLDTEGAGNEQSRQRDELTGSSSTLREVESRIERNQMSYVLGNIAGRDLVGADGQIIIAKGQTITREVLERAKDEGKIAELIVYMIVPGLDKESQNSPSLGEAGGC